MAVPWFYTSQMLLLSKVWDKLENPWRYCENQKERAFVGSPCGVRPIKCSDWNLVRNTDGFGNCCTGNFGGGCYGNESGAIENSGGCCIETRPAPYLKIPSVILMFIILTWNISNFGKKAYSVPDPICCPTKTQLALRRIECEVNKCSSPCSELYSGAYERYCGYRNCRPRNLCAPYTPYQILFSGDCPTGPPRRTACGRSGYEFNHNSYLYDKYNGGCTLNRLGPNCRGCPTTYNGGKPGWGNGTLDPSNKGCCIPLY